MLETFLKTSRMVLMLLLIIASGCIPLIPVQETAPQQTPFFRPPTPVRTGTSQIGQQNPGNSTGAATPTVECSDNLTFLSDQTIPDGTIVSPGSTLDKRWEVENSGNCNWGQDYRIRIIAGPEMSAQKEQALYPARSGTRAVIRILFKAPDEPGTYRSAWQSFNEQGEPFGDPFFIEIMVQ